MRRSICELISAYIGEKRLIIIKNLLRAGIFICVGVIMFLLMQNIFIPRENRKETRILSSFYEEQKDTIDVIFAGTSHAEFGIYPMEIYENYGIVSFNISTPSQPLEVSYYSLKEAIKTQNIKVFVVDASSLLLGSAKGESVWRYLSDSMPFSLDKVQLAKDFVEITEVGNIYDKIFPLLRYHDRWKQLYTSDFTDLYRNKHIYSKSVTISSIIDSSDITTDEMNSVVNEMLERSNRVDTTFTGEEVHERQSDNVLYNVDISDYNLGILLKIKELCDQNNIDLLLIKVPAVNYPQYYNAAWTLQRSEAVRALCRENNIDFFDMVYDIDLGINWLEDSMDGGAHLNYKGAVKVSSILGKYLKEHYDFEEKHLSQWDKDLETYKRLKRVAELQTETDFVKYLNRIANEYCDKTVYIVASEDMSVGLSEEDVNALRNLGLKADYSSMYRDGYIAVIKDGHAQHETYSNQYVEYYDQLKNGTMAYLRSKGWYCGSDATIKINDNDYSMKERGLNIVVYDEELDMVWDSVCFDTSMESHTGYRNSGSTMYYLQQYENYLTEIENR